MPAANDSGCAYLLRFSGILKSVADAGLWTSREATCTWRTLSERGHADVRVGEGLGGVGDLSQDLAGVVAAEHGQLVHCPVPAADT